MISQFSNPVLSSKAKGQETVQNSWEAITHLQVYTPKKKVTFACWSNTLDPQSTGTHPPVKTRLFSEMASAPVWPSGEVTRLASGQYWSNSPLQLSMLLKVAVYRLTLSRDCP